MTGRQLLGPWVRSGFLQVGNGRARLQVVKSNSATPSNTQLFLRDAVEAE